MKFVLRKDLYLLYLLTATFRGLYKAQISHIPTYTQTQKYIIESKCIAGINTSIEFTKNKTKQTKMSDNKLQRRYLNTKAML